MDRFAYPLLDLGEAALNIRLNVKDAITRSAQGSFYLAQMLGREICMEAGILEELDERRVLGVSFEAVKARVHERLGRAFRSRCERFCRGTKIRKEGRAPYLHILHWLAQSNEWTLSLREAIREHASLRGSVSQVVDKGYLGELIQDDEDIQAVLHFDRYAEQLTVEDPQYLFYIRNIPWKNFAKELGFISVEFQNRYDFALSFAGSDRKVAAALFRELEDAQLEVFYDRNEQHRILAEDVEEYLRPIYQSEAQFIVALLGPDYPKRIWTKIESDAFKKRFGEGAVIPIWFTNAPPGTFDESARVGGLEFDPGNELGPQVTGIAETLLKKLAEARPQT